MRRREFALADQDVEVWISRNVANHNRLPTTPDTILVLHTLHNETLPTLDTILVSHTLHIVYTMEHSYWRILVSHTLDTILVSHTLETILVSHTLHNGTLLLEKSYKYAQQSKVALTLATNSTTFQTSQCKKTRQTCKQTTERNQTEIKTKNVVHRQHWGHIQLTNLTKLRCQGTQSGPRPQRGE